MNPTDEAISKIQDRVAASSDHDWTMGDQALADAMNEDLVDNPETAETVPVPYGMADIMGHLEASTIKTVRSEGNMSAIADAVRDNDDNRVLTWADAYLQTGDLSQTEFDAIHSTVTDTQEDPGYEPQIPWPEKVLGRLVDANDISQSRP